jgi:toxin ParE1/3/4
MPLRIERSARSEEDLLDIWSFIATDNEPAADRLLRRILDKLYALAEHPDMGRSRGELGAGVRYLPFGSYLIFYSREADVLRLLRVLNAARELKPEMFEDLD